MALRLNEEGWCNFIYTAYSYQNKHKLTRHAADKINYSP